MDRPRLAYDDLEVMHIEQTARVVDAAGQSANRQLPEISFERNDTLSLDNDEGAELIAAVFSLKSYVDDNDSVTGNFRSRVDVGLNFADAGWNRDNDLETDNLGNSGELAGRTRLENDPRIIWTDETTYVSSQDGGSNQVITAFPGGGVVRDMVHYRSLFGQGPLVDNDDHLQIGTAFNAVSMGGTATAVTILSMTAYFDVFEYERAVVHR